MFTTMKLLFLQQQQPEITISRLWYLPNPAIQPGSTLTLWSIDNKGLAGWGFNSTLLFLQPVVGSVLPEEFPHPVEKAFVLFIRIGFEIGTSPQTLQHFSFFIAQILRCPYVDGSKHITPLSAID